MGQNGRIKCTSVTYAVVVELDASCENSTKSVCNQMKTGWKTVLKDKRSDISKPLDNFVYFLRQRFKHQSITRIFKVEIRIKKEGKCLFIGILIWVFWLAPLTRAWRRHLLLKNSVIVTGNFIKFIVC